MDQTAFVLAGGGVAGIAWQTGFLLGLHDAEPAVGEEILAAGTLVGTSAGATVAAQIASGTPLGELFEAQISERTAELTVELDLAAFGATMAAAVAHANSPEDARRRLGALALNAVTPTPAARRAVIEARRPSHSWPDRRVLITAVDTETGELRVFDRKSGVGLVDAVAASCAVPGIWPPVEIEGRRYMDGGMRSTSNADLAAGADRVLILVPGPQTAPSGAESVPATELAALGPAAVRTVFADSDSSAAFGTNPLDPSTRRAAAEAGRAQGRKASRSVAEFWNRSS